MQQTCGRVGRVIAVSASRAKGWRRTKPSQPEIAAGDHDAFETEFNRERIPRHSGFRGMSAPQHFGFRNHLLKALPARELKTVRQLLQCVELQRGEVLLEVGAAVQFMYFPETSVLSISQPYASGSTVEVAAVGCEGMACISSAFDGSERSCARHSVQIEGRAMRLKRTDFDELFASQPSFRSLTLAYGSGFIAAMLLSIACNRLHPVEPRLARWLLVTLDRSVCNDLPLTHEVMAEMLGVHRPTVTNALQTLERSGAIVARRGRVGIIDRQLLERHACECFELAATRLPARCGK